MAVGLSFGTFHTRITSSHPSALHFVRLIHRFKVRNLAEKMSFCVLACGRQVCLVESKDIAYDCSRLTERKKLKNKFFYVDSVKVDILFHSGTMN